jgi:hypothetical protein
MNPSGCTLSRNVPAAWRIVMVPACSSQVQISPVNQFHYTLNPGTAGVETHTIPYTVTDGDPAVLDIKQLRVAHFIPNCMAGPRRASLRALFDDVMVNP